MENRTTTIERETSFTPFASNESNDKQTKDRLDSLLAANAEYARKYEIFKSDAEELEAELMSNPLSIEKAFSYFGLMLGAIPPAIIFGKWFSEVNIQSPDASGFIFLFALVIIVSAIVGYFSGKVVGKVVKELEKVSWVWMLLAMPFVGLLWGIVSGGAGGIFVFLIGAIFGAIIGGMVGGVALPAFTLLYWVFKRDNRIDSKHFYPIAFGITAIISAFILGM